MMTFSKRSLSVALVMATVLGTLAADRAAAGQTRSKFLPALAVTATPKTGSPSDYYLTFSGPVGVPGVSLPPGTYLFRFPLDNAAKVIQVLRADRSNVYAMFHSIPVERTTRTKPTDAHEVTWNETPADAPPTIRAWFLPGQSAGYEFVYPKPATAKAQTPKFTDAIVVTAAPKSGSPSDYMLTFSGPVAVPGVSLAAGTYLFRFPSENSKAIQVLKADRSNAYAMFHTIPVEQVKRSLASDGHDMTWNETAIGAPPAIKAWFLPSQTTGFEFVYPK